MNNEIKKTLNASIHNRFDIEIIDSKTGEVKQKAKAFNTICNNLWLKLGSYFGHIHFGTGNGTPSQNDTTLFNFLGSKYVSSVSREISEYFSFNRETGVFSVKRYITILEDEYVGYTLTEVGIGSGSGSTTLCTHAMLQDMDGNQVSIEKTNTDIIIIYATIFVHVDPFGYDNGSMFFDIANGTYSDLNSIMSYFAGIDSTLGSSSNARAFFYSSLLDSSKNYVTVSGKSTTFDASTKKLTITFNRLPAASGNFANGILRVNMGVWHNATFGSDTLPLMCLNINDNSEWFSHSEIENEAVGIGDGTTKDFDLKFPFASDVKIFVNGVQTTDFTVDYGVNATDFLPFMERLRTFSTAEHHVIYFYGSNYYSAGSTAIYYNPMHNIGIESINADYTGTKFSIEVSNDLSDWTYITETGDGKNTKYAIPTQYQKYKYWKFVNLSSSAQYLPKSVTPASSYTGKVLHFTNPPAEGAVITANYKSKCIAKDENNVFDLTVEIQVGEYTE